jgi:glutamate dehydrogenase
MQRWALQAIREDALKARRALAAETLSLSPGAEPVVAVEGFLHEHRGDARRLEVFLRVLAREGEPDLAGLTLAVRQLDSLVS